MQQQQQQDMLSNYRGFLFLIGALETAKRCSGPSAPFQSFAFKRSEGLVYRLTSAIKDELALNEVGVAAISLHFCKWHCGLSIIMRSPGRLASEPYKSLTSRVRRLHVEGRGRGGDTGMAPTTRWPGWARMIQGAASIVVTGKNRLLTGLTAALNASLVVKGPGEPQIVC